MSEKLLPELHDIGKLIDKRATRIEHNLENFEIQLDTETWKGITQHHCSDHFKMYPKEVNTLKLCVADNLASGVSRQKSEYESDHVFNVYKLWNPPHDRLTQSLIRSDREVKGLIEFISKDPSIQDFFDEFGEKLKIRTQDATEGRNLTSLLTHSLLTGKFYRILRQEENFSVKQESIKGASKDEISKLITQCQQTWKMFVVLCRFHFSQKPSRLKDLNIFELKKKMIDVVEQSFGDNIMFSTGDEMLLVCPSETTIQEIMDIAMRYFFWVELSEARANLASIKSKTYNALGFEGEKNIHANLEKEIKPPLCEICQMGQATKKWIDEESEIEEDLCENCWKIRDMGSFAKKFQNWELENPKIVWVKISLSIDDLIDILRNLYIEYLEFCNVAEPEEHAEIRFSVISEFQWDFHDFLKELKIEFEKRFGNSNIEYVLEDLYCIKLEKTKEIREIVEIYKKVFLRFFPKFNRASPMKLSLSCSNMKYPFFWHWRYLENPEEDIVVSLIGKGKMNIKLRQLEELFNIQLPSTKFLHKLNEAAEISKKFAWLVMSDRENKREYDSLRSTLMTTDIGFDNLLTYSKIMGD